MTQPNYAKLLGAALRAQTETLGEITLEIAPEKIARVCTTLRDHSSTHFETLIDLCGVDYSSWGKSDGDVGDIGDGAGGEPDARGRFAVVYHLLSLKHNRRLRLRARLDDPGDEPPAIDSVVEVWPAANWYEREAFDLYGILFRGHPDLRRLLTDYGFIGHPFRKDFPLSGEVEMHYDETHGRVVYRPVSIDPRTLVPRTIGAGDGS